MRPRRGPRIARHENVDKRSRVPIGCDWTAPTECEVKLELPPAAVPQFHKLPLIRGIKAPAKRTFEVSVYFDTDEQRLRRHGILLRVRRIGRRYVQTIKATRDSDMFARDEWEWEIADGESDLSLARGTALDRVLKPKSYQRLKPMFETRVRRTVFPLAAERYAIDVTLDQGTIDIGSASRPLCEIELELHRGELRDLFEVARRMSHALPAQLGLRSKAARGFGLLNGEEQGATKFPGVALSNGMTTRETFKRICRACLQQIVANEPALLRGDGEGVHQMRVGIRRLRAAISLFTALLRDPETEKIKDELKWLTGELGPAREFEVLINRVVKPVRERKSKWDGMASLSKEFAERRAAALAQAHAAVGSERFRMLALDIAAWLEFGPRIKPEDDLIRDRGNLSIEQFASEQLAQRWRKIRKKHKSFVDLDASQRHKLRIQAKKLRYAAEFFGDLFPGKQAIRLRAKFLAALERVQDCLGDLNDITVHENIISDAAIRQRRAGRRGAFAAGLLIRREDTRLNKVKAAAEAALKRFAQAKPYWS
jgi:triphosphatase